jgi:hypothetical protein
MSWAAVLGGGASTTAARGAWAAAVGAGAAATAAKVAGVVASAAARVGAGLWAAAPDGATVAGADATTLSGRPTVLDPGTQRLRALRPPRGRGHPRRCLVHMCRVRAGTSL